MSDHKKLDNNTKYESQSQGIEDATTGFTYYEGGRHADS